jgi:hypothetical protein
MWWFVYTAAMINLIIIWFMPKRLTRREIYVTWLVIVAINLSVDLMLSLYFKAYELDGKGIQPQVHLIEWLLGPSHGVIFLNFMPKRIRTFAIYVMGWLVYSLLFEAVTVHLHFVNYYTWKLWYSAIVYLLTFLFLRWHIWFIRKNP